KGVMGINADTTLFTEPDFNKYAPYLWNYFPAWDTVMTNFGRYVCDRLTNISYLAKYTDDASLDGRPRKFGLILGQYPDGSKPDITIFKNALQACGITVGAGMGRGFMPQSDIVYGSGDQVFK